MQAMQKIKESLALQCKHPRNPSHCSANNQRLHGIAWQKNRNPWYCSANNPGICPIAVQTTQESMASQESMALHGKQPRNLWHCSANNAGILGNAAQTTQESQALQCKQAKLLNTMDCKNFENPGHSRANHSWCCLANNPGLHTISEEVMQAFLSEQDTHRGH